ncbi:hypothetical protein [Actinomyces sp.]|uniref:hypothetical protein n=1 Tax=Actinomyces sp. TaxID=29317 RepID=UPI0026DC27BA|nr:hypothetical protein [Actinomyces sp.]MDO4900697.1 hypothetical protein [Actinomyces sp.]
MVVADGIEIDTDVLRSGGSDALGVADGVGVVVDAGGQALASDAFGVLCSPLFVPAYALLSTAVAGAVGSTGQSVEDAGLGLRAVAQELDDTDDDAATGARALGGW